MREAICRKFKRDNNLDFTVDQIVCSTGAKQSLANLCLSLLNPKDQVLLPCPYWVSYAQIIKLAEGVSVEIPSTIATDFKVSADELEAAITPKTKLLMFWDGWLSVTAAENNDFVSRVSELFSQ